MRVALALYAEGPTDYRFLTLIIQRTSNQILAMQKRNNANIVAVEPVEFSEKRASRAENILQAARQAVGYQALIIHSDADDHSQDKALVERINPGRNLVEQSKETVCEKVLPIIPIQALEAWMLSDYETLRTQLRTGLTARELGIPEKGKQIESISKPKDRLKAIIARVNQQRRSYNKVDIGSLYEPLGQKVRIERLRQLSAYQQFEQDLTQVFVELELIEF